MGRNECSSMCGELNKVEAISFLLENSADIDIFGGLGSPIFGTILYNLQFEAAKLLVQSGCNLDLISEHGKQKLKPVVIAIKDEVNAVKEKLKKRNWPPIAIATVLLFAHSEENVLKLTR